LLTDWLAVGVDSQFLFAYLMSPLAHSLRAAVYRIGDGAIKRGAPILALRQDRIETRRFRFLYGLRMTTPFVIGFELPLWIPQRRVISRDVAEYSATAWKLHRDICAATSATLDGTSIAVTPSRRRRLIEGVEKEETYETNAVCGFDDQFHNPGSTHCRRG
jgi:hypothetical protein